ncbi:shikimate kinase [candidate division KSB1 bacterium]|nr:shikimate kinase [candidate division KSB1 bacterium]
MGIVFLTGMPGSGKSSAGRELARVMARPFCDLDELIVEQAKLTIPEIFSSRGESAFRAVETAALETALERTEAVIALGGGTLIAPHNLELVRDRGVLVYLAAPIEVLCRRLGTASGRPLVEGLVSGDDIRRKLEALWRARRATYESAHVVVWSGTTSSLEQVVKQISERILK